jgi:hypothetical protein
MLIAGPSVYICDECVDVCKEILTDNKEPRIIEEGQIAGAGREWPANASYIHCALCRMPSLPEQATLVQDRGVLCEVCIDAILATLELKKHDQ